MKRSIVFACAGLLACACLRAEINPKLTGTVMQHGARPTTRLPERLTVGLRIDGTEGCLATGKGLVVGEALPAENKDGSVWIDLGDKPDQGVRLGAPLAIPVLIETPGVKSVWLRCKVEKRSFVMWGVDNFARRAVLNVPEDAKDQPAQWRWVKLTDRAMKHGEVMLRLRGHVGAVTADRLAVLPRDTGAPEGRGGEPFTKRPNKAVITTRSTTLPQVRRLVKPVADVSGNARLAWSISTDGGKKWTPADAASLAKMNPPKGPLTVALRLEITPQEANRSVILGGLSLEVQPDAAGWAAATNDFVQVQIDRTTGRLVRLRDVKNNRDLVWPGKPQRLFSLDLKQKGQDQWLRYSDEKTQLIKLVEGRRGTDHEAAEGLGPGVAEQIAGAQAQPAHFTGVKTTDDSIVMTWTVETNVAVIVTVKLDDTGQALWSIDVANNHPELDVIQVEFPRLQDVRIGAVGDDDRQVRFQTFDQDSDRPGIRPVRDAIYPGGCALPWESIYDEAGGLSRISRDRGASNLAFESSTEGVFGDVVSVTTRKLDRIAAGGGRKTWEYAVAVHPGAWHWAADRYREWALGHFVRPVYPQWFETNDGFWFHGQMNHGSKYTDYPKIAGWAKRVGLNHVQVWGQFTDRRYGCCGPYWQPSPRYGTLQEFVQGIAEAKKMGVRMGFYFLHDRVDLYHPKGTHIYGFINKNEYPAGTEFPSDEMFNRLQWVGDPAGTQRAYPLDEAAWADYRKRVKAHQDDPKANSAPRRWHPVDISDPVWWEYMRHWAVDNYAGRWGAAGIYNDVLATGTARVSYDPRKDHHGTSIAGAGKAGIARTVVESARQKGYEEFFHLCEGAGDIAIQWCAPANTGIYRFKTEMIRYTWPDAVIFEGTAGQGSRNLQTVRRTAWINGNRFDTRQGNNETARIITARAAIRNWVYKARYLEQLGIVQSPVHARLFRRLDDNYDGVTVAFGYDRRSEHADKLSVEATVTLEADRVGPVRRGVVIGHRGTMQPVRLLEPRAPNRVAFAATIEPFAAALLVDKAALPDGLVVLPVVDRTPTVEAVEVKLANLTDAEVAGRVVPRAFGAYDTPQPQSFRCPPGAVTGVRFPLTGGHGTFARAAFDIEVGGNLVKTSEVSIYPLIEDPSFEATGNDEVKAAEGKRSLRLDAKDGFNARVPSIYPEPGRRYRLRVKMLRPDKGRGSKFIRLIQSADFGVEVQRTAHSKVSEDWQTLEILFDTPPIFVDHRLYMYNNNSTTPLWYDDLTLEDLGPVTKE